uniref:Kinesin-like protein n=1 Tax=Florenciella parvula TaxID=236787 RepID=A0A7S2BUC2_9STRA
MEGPPDDRGVNFRSLEELFSLCEQRSDKTEYTLTLSYLEIYNETVRDLLDDTPRGRGGPGGAEEKKLDVRQTADGNVVPGLTEVPVTNIEEVMSLMARGTDNRAVGSHDMNEHSSRSHSIMTINLVGRNIQDAGTVRSKLHLIDLAGSERVSKTDATGERLKEAQNINKSLSALGDVINALSGKKAAHVPYRNSKLTFLLQDSLAGNSKVMMFCNFSPASYNCAETMCSLNFAARCRAVELGQAKKGSEGAEVAKLKRMVAKLTEKLNGGGAEDKSSKSGRASLTSPQRGTDSPARGKR